MKNLNLKIARIHAGLTQLQLAEKSGVSLSRISRIEAGCKMPSVDELEALSRVLGVQLKQLLSSRWKKCHFVCICRKQNLHRPIYTKTKGKTMSTRQSKSLPSPPFKIFAALFAILSVFAIVKGLDAAAAVSTVCLLLLIFAKFLPSWKISLKDYFSFYKDEK
jgi:DNA-binding XRE family transcriptional regulator